MSRYVLCVDDNPSDLAMVQALVEREDFQPIVSRDGYGALDLINDYDFKLLIVDLQMPGFSGIDLIRTVRKMKLDIPIFVVSGRNRPGDVKAAIQAGAFDYIIKPVDFSVFEEKFGRLLGNSQNWEEYSVEDQFGFVKDKFELKSICEVSLSFFTNKKLEIDQSLQLSVGPLENNEEDSDFQVIIQSSIKKTDGYLVKAHFTGLTESQRKRIRLYCKKLWQEKKQGELE